MKLKYAILDIKAEGFNKIKKVFSSNYKIEGSYFADDYDMEVSTEEQKFGDIERIMSDIEYDIRRTKENFKKKEIRRKNEREIIKRTKD